MIITRNAANIHTLAYTGDELNLLLISDLHWDNPKCDRDLLKRHLDAAKAKGAGVIVNGDFFCLMQGKGDPRKSKDDIRPEHNKGNYLQAVVEDAVEWFSPYKDNLLLIGYGNHETQIIKHMEFDPLQMFQSIYNYKNQSNLHIGGYGGTLKVLKNIRSTLHRAFVIHYYHGSGGGGPVTKGVIQDQRIMSFVEGYDLTWQGHVHELYHHVNMVQFFNRTQDIIQHRRVHQLRTSTYKEEYGAGDFGYHIEKGRPPKPMGGYWLNLQQERLRTTQDNGKERDRTEWVVKLHTT